MLSAEVHSAAQARSEWLWLLRQIKQHATPCKFSQGFGEAFLGASVSHMYSIEILLVAFNGASAKRIVVF